MKSTLICIGFAIIAIIVMVGISFGGGLISLEFTKFFAPRKEEIRREVFEHTKSYVQGKIQILVKNRLEYMREKDPESKAALRSAILHQMADFDKSLLPNDLRLFITKLETNNY